MTDLEKLGLRRISELTQEVEKGLTSINVKLMSKENIDFEKDMYPVQGKVRDIQEWVEAIEENIEKTED